MTPTQYFLELNRASVSRNERLILKNVSLKIREDEHLAILGPNGSGKSTLLKLITGELLPLAHQQKPIKIFGSDLWNLWDLRQRVGFVSNDLQDMYKRECSGLDVILSGFFGSIGIFSNMHPTKQQKEQALEISKFLGIQKLLTSSIETMSSGEARKFLIARALVHDPKILIFDEPTNSLDPRAKTILLKTMSKLARRHYSIILVTHNIAEIIPEIERIVMLQAGRVYADDSRQKLLNPSTLSKLFKTKFSKLT